LGDYGKAAADKAAPTDQTDWYETTLPYETTDQAARLFLSFGTEVLTIAPLDLRARIAWLCEQVAQSHFGQDNIVPD
jgi:predicted DNA-binding transcriptional regulator YafY